MSLPHTIVVASPQGGSGKSTIAVNLAMQLAKQNLRVLLVDMTVYSSIPAMMRIPIRGKGMSSLITALEQSESRYEIGQFSNLFFDAVYQLPDLEQLHVLLSATPLKMEKLSAAYTGSLLQSAKRENYNVIVVDTSPELSERNIACFEEADQILIPTLQDVSAGWKVMQFKEILDSLNITKEHVGLIVNRCDKHSTFNNREYESELGYSIASEINDLTKIAIKTAHKGIPLANSNKRAAVQPYLKLATQILKKAGSRA